MNVDKVWSSGPSACANLVGGFKRHPYYVFHCSQHTSEIIFQWSRSFLGLDHLWISNKTKVFKFYGSTLYSRISNYPFMRWVLYQMRCWSLCPKRFELWITSTPGRGVISWPNLYQVPTQSFKFQPSSNETDGTTFATPQFCPQKTLHSFLNNSNTLGGR